MPVDVVSAVVTLFFEKLWNDYPSSKIIQHPLFEFKFEIGRWATQPNKAIMKGFEHS
jgi:hypothetical protein